MTEEVQARLAAAFAGAEVAVSADGNRFEIRIVSDAFEGLSRVKRQQAVYAEIRDLIASGAIHAVGIRAMTPAESD